MLINIDSESEEISVSMGANHVLYLKDLRNDKQRIIYKYDRYIEVSWSPTGDRIVKNDHYNSN